MATKKVHWAYKGVSAYTCAGPNQVNRRSSPKRTTTDPKRVTCERCKKLFAGDLLAADGGSNNV